jgi:hypothetical protein
LATRSDRDPALWYGRCGPLTPSGVHQIFRRRAIEAGIRADVRRLVHACRATFAKHYIKRGGSLGDLAELLGHSTLTMAAYYAALADDDLAAKKAANAHARRPMAAQPLRRAYFVAQHAVSHRHTYVAGNRRCVLLLRSPSPGARSCDQTARAPRGIHYHQGPL